MILLIPCSWGQLQMWGWFLALSIPGGFITVMFSLGKEQPTSTVFCAASGSVVLLCSRSVPSSHHELHVTGIFVWFIWKRDKNPDKYGPARYGLPERGPGALPVSQQSLNMGAVPSKYDP